jgi:hypothetical protein
MAVQPPPQPVDPRRCQRTCAESVARASWIPVVPLKPPVATRNVAFIRLATSSATGIPLDARSCRMGDTRPRRRHRRLPERAAPRRLLALLARRRRRASRLVSLGPADLRQRRSVRAVPHSRAEPCACSTRFDRARRCERVGRTRARRGTHVLRTGF